MPLNEQNRTTLKRYFETGDRPTEDQFSQLIDSCLNKKEDGVTIGPHNEIGIGTPDPEFSLDVANATGKFFRFGRGQDSGRIWADYLDFAPRLFLSDKDDTPRIQFQQIGSQTEDNPEFSTWIGMGKSLTNTLVLMGGNVGIGVADPRATLHLKTPGNRFENSDTALLINNSGRQRAVFQANGPNGAYRITIQDGHGRVHHLWNAYDGVDVDGNQVHQYDKSGEGAAWLLMSSGILSIRTAPSGTADNPIPFNTGFTQHQHGNVSFRKDVSFGEGISQAWFTSNQQHPNNVLPVSSITKHNVVVARCCVKVNGTNVRIEGPVWNVKEVTRVDHGHYKVILDQRINKFSSGHVNVISNSQDKEVSIGTAKLSSESAVARTQSADSVHVKIHTLYFTGSANSGSARMSGTGASRNAVDFVLTVIGSTYLGDPIRVSRERPGVILHDIGPNR